MTGSVTEFLTIDDALEVARLVTGEPARVRDFADLTAALARPQQTTRGQDVFPGIWDKAAALMEWLGRSYALVDGNKRLTWNATWYFLGMNGHPLAEPLDEDAAFEFMYDLVRGRLTSPHRVRAAPVRRLTGPGPRTWPTAGPGWARPGGARTSGSSRWRSSAAAARTSPRAAP